MRVRVTVCVARQSYTPLAVACMTDREDAAKCLLNHRADMMQGVQVNNGRFVSALFVAVRCNAKQCLELMMIHNIDLDNHYMRDGTGEATYPSPTQCPAYCHQ